ncbi:hypothetical protein [Shewanella sp. Scap07]|nr:hypothetical protein [Shewanella sp. Scap07]
MSSLVRANYVDGPLNGTSAVWRINSPTAPATKIADEEVERSDTSQEP